MNVRRIIAHKTRIDRKLATVTEWKGIRWAIGVSPDRQAMGS